MKFFYVTGKILFQVYFLFILTWYNPFSFFLLGSSIAINLDFLMLYFIFQSYFMSRSQLIFLGCFLGFLIDLDLETSLIGVNSFFMSIAAYFLSLVKINSSNWKNLIKYTFIYLICVTVYINKYIFYNYQIGFFDLISCLINSLIILITLLMVNYFYSKEKIL